MEIFNIIKPKNIYFVLGIYALYANALKIFNNITIAYYPVFFLLCFLTFIISYKKKNKLNIELLVFILICLASLLFNETKQEYNLYFRFISYIMLLYIFSPLIINSDLEKYRNKLFFYITISLEVLSFATIIILLIPGLGYGRGGFTGPYIHSMVAGPFFGITTLHFISYYQISKRKIVILSTLISLFFTIYTASRISAFALLFSIVIYYLIFYKTSIPKALVISILSLLFLILIIYVSRILFPSLFINIDKKIYNQTFYESRRYYLLSQRIYEYNSSPIIGVGFSNTLFEETLNSADGRLEPGTSWLFILSSIGTLGFISFIFIYIKSFYICLKLSNVYNSSLLISILSFYGVHMCMEGYILACGNSLTIYFWLLISQIYSQQQDLKKQTQTKQYCNTSINNLLSNTIK